EIDPSAVFCRRSKGKFYVFDAIVCETAVCKSNCDTAWLPWAGMLCPFRAAVKSDASIELCRHRLNKKTAWAEAHPTKLFLLLQVWLVF
ncbi:MAG: hypothetical protein WC770_10135, partial [Phycisphaerae bacterium]